MTRLIRDLIDIPEQVYKSDFVLKLADGLQRPNETLRDYVVTDQLRLCFQRSLDLVRHAVEGHRSVAAFLHGSFGSGKSHFMAVLHLLLQNHPEARSIPALAPVVAKLGWAEGKRFLLIPFHLIGNETLEQAVLGHYVEYVRKLHPDAPLPAVYLAEPIFADAINLRSRMGDEAFFAGLNRGKEGQATGGWGKLGDVGWTRDSFAEALAAPPQDSRRLDLVSDLVSRFFTSYQDIAASGRASEAFVPLDRGLSIISHHAQSLGYHGLVLFLDELILWLASRVADMSFVTREASKVAKLVEAEAADRPVPIISFIARQRDLRELIGDHYPGAEKLSFSDTLKWSEGRFDTVTLEDRNLPVIARQRLLRPRSDEARRELDGAFETTRKVREEVLTALLGREGSPDTFRDGYPFSPALVQALVALSSALQRERTALRVMLQLLVDQRDTLQLGAIVPLGDLFDVIAEGDEPFNEAMRIHFDQAKRLYHLKLLPLLEHQHGITREQARSLPWDDPRVTAFRGDDRLVKTLLLAALTPDVEALRDMTAGRLAALNHGSIRSPIPGSESRTVMNRFRQWAAQVGEIRLTGDPNNPTIALQLSGVDTESILAKVRDTEDNRGNRMRTIRQLLFAELGLPFEDSLFPTVHKFRWRGTERQVEVVFANIRELPNDALRTKGDDWKIVIDFPFDAEGYSTRDDLTKLETFRADEADTATFCWVPAFFTHEALRDLGTYVVLDYLLTSESRFSDNASHLSAVERAQARALLDNQRSQLKQRLIHGLEAAYGVAPDPAGMVDPSVELADRFQSLDRRFRPQPPAAANLSEALNGLLDQIQSWRFPKHPRFEVDLVRTRDLRNVLKVALEAAHAPQGRVDVEKELRQTMRQIANPLGLGQMHEAAFVLSDQWRNQLTRGSAAAGGAVTVGKLRAAIDQPDALGLPREVQDLLFLVFAEQTNRSFVRYGAAVKGDLGQLQDEVELREQKLPEEAVWHEARERAAKIFGLAPPASYLSAANVGQLREDLGKAVHALRGPVSDLGGALRRWMSTFGVDPAAAPRMRTAEALHALVEDLTAAPADRLLETLASGTIETSAEAMGNAGTRSERVVQALADNSLELLSGLLQIEDPRRQRAEEILSEVREALTRDELAVNLPDVVQRSFRQATQLLLVTPPKREPEPLPPPPPGWKVVQQATREGLDPKSAEDLFQELAKKLREPGESRLRVSWTLERRTGES
jgi:hypothetical protein